jgi:hypothetical protein
MKTKDVVSGKFGTHGKMRNAYRSLVKNLEGLGVERKFILKCVLRRKCNRM